MYGDQKSKKDRLPQKPIKTSAKDKAMKAKIGKLVERSRKMDFNK